MAYSVTCPRCNKRHKVKEMPALGFIRCLGCKAQISMDNDENDGEGNEKTYTVESKSCPSCKKPLAQGAVICVECGYNLKTKKKMTTEVNVKPIHRTWWNGFPGFHTAFELIRERDGDLYMTYTPHLCFIPLGTRDIEVKECTDVLSDYTEGLGPGGIMIVIFLALLCGFPGILWWWAATQYPTYSAYLRLPTGRDMELYSGWDESQMRHILDTISEATQLPVSRK